MLAESTQVASGKKHAGPLLNNDVRQLGLGLELDCLRYEPIRVPDYWLSPVDLEALPDEPDDLTPEQRKDYCATLLGQTVVHYKAMRRHMGRIIELVEQDGNAGLPAKMLGDFTLEGMEARQRALYGVAQWTFEDGQDPNETPVYMGAIGSSLMTVEAIEQLNKMKEVFSELVRRLRLATETQSVLRGDVYALLNLIMDAEPKMVRSKMIGEMLRQVLHPRLNVRLLTRSIPALPEQPESIRWRWHQFSSSRRLSRDQVLALLEKKSDKPLVMQDIEKIHTDCRDEYFVLKKPPQWDLRMHITVARSVEKKRVPVDFKTRMPLFYWAGEPSVGIQEPKMSVAPENAIQFQRKKKIETEPYLTTLPIYRYVRD